MKHSRRGICFLAVALFMGSLAAWAQFNKEYTPQFLRAAIGTIRDRASVSVVGEFDTAHGLVEASENYLRGKGYGRFHVKDPDSGTVFESMYCKHDTDAFKTLLGTKGRVVYRFSGYKDQGDELEEAVYVTRAEVVRRIQPPAGEAAATRVRPLRVTITGADGTRTVLVNVIRGQAYKVDGLTIQVEDEPGAR